MIGSARRVAMAIGMAGCLLSAAAVLPGSVAAAPAGATVGTAGWGIVPSPNGSQGGDNTLIQVSPGSTPSAWAVGYDGQAGGFQTMTQRWNGSRWTVVPSPSPSSFDNTLFGIATVSGTDAWAVGYDVADHGLPYHRPLIEHWTGSAWRTVPAVRAGTQDNDLWAVTALSGSDVWAVGNENTGHFRFRPLAEHWNGTAWSLVPVPSPPLTGTGASLFGISAISPRDIWAVGNYATTTGFQPLAEHWNGTRWTIVPTPVAGSAQFSRVSMVAPDDGWAVGARGGAGHSRALAEHWNGHRWTVAATPAVAGSSSLADVRTVNPGLAWAVGSSSPAAGQNRTLIERWNGHAWLAVPSPDRGPSSELLGIGGTPQRMWSVGDSATATLIVRRR